MIDISQICHHGEICGLQDRPGFSFVAIQSARAQTPLQPRHKCAISPPRHVNRSRQSPPCRSLTGEAISSQTLLGYAAWALSECAPAFPRACILCKCGVDLNRCPLAGRPPSAVSLAALFVTIGLALSGAVIKFYRGLIRKIFRCTGWLTACATAGQSTWRPP